MLRLQPLVLPRHPCSSFVLRQPECTPMVPDVTYPPTRLALRTIVVLGGIRVVSKRLQRRGGTLSLSDYSAYLSRIRESRRAGSNR